jgi:hypothetical protein
MWDEEYAKHLAQTEQWEKLKSYDAAAYARLRGESNRSLKDINSRISPPTPAAVLKHAVRLFEFVEGKVRHEIDTRAYKDKKIWKALNELDSTVRHQAETIRQQQRLIDELRGRR